MKIDLIDNPSDETINVLSEKLAAFTQAQREVSARYPIAVVITDSQENIIAGAEGVSFGDWFHLNSLWLDKPLRGQGYGSKILQKIEQAAKKRGCKSCLLTTLDFQAKPFYQKHGYQVVWCQEDYPKTGCKYFMSKKFSD